MEALALSASNVGVMVISRSATTMLKSHVIHLKMITVANQEVVRLGGLCVILENYVF